MFKGKEISVLGWIILILILSVPILNVIFVIWALVSHKANKTVKNFFVAFLIFWALAFFGISNGSFDALQGLFG